MLHHNIKKDLDRREEERRFWGGRMSSMVVKNARILTWPLMNAFVYFKFNGFNGQTKFVFARCFDNLREVRKNKF